MKLLNIWHQDKHHLGVWEGDQVRLVEPWHSVDEFLASGQGLETLTGDGPRVPFDEADIRPALLKPGKVICIGLNYRKHAIETGAAIPTVPVVFSKFSDTVAAHQEVIEIPPGTEQLDYEVELAIVIGQRVYQVPEENALQPVFGYAVANDLSARDLQHRTSQWLLGKNGPQFLPIGPAVTTSDEIPDPNALSLRTYRNGELVQDSTTADMIFSCRELVAYLSHYLVLEPGDVILTGTPAGVVMGYPEGERKWLSEGDYLRMEIEGLGELENSFRNPE